jgi:hypothetical protein
MKPLVWQQIQKIGSHKYVCGYCCQPLASENGWTATRHELVGRSYEHVVHGKIYVCHNCSSPTFFDIDTGKQTPGVTFGEPVHNVADKAVAEIYEEARKATSAGCYTAAVLCCRKLLMHVAVARGAAENQSFKSYVQYLADKNYVPPDCRLWVDQIRELGNEANHEVSMMGKEDAEQLVTFCEMLLKIFYEFPAAAKARNGTK